MSADLSPAEIDILIRQNGAPNGGGTLEGLALTQLCAEIARLREALAAIDAAHVPDQPATSGGDGVVWALRHVAAIRRIARAALEE